jgi:hypothetical protein
MRLVSIREDEEGSVITACFDGFEAERCDVAPHDDEIIFGYTSEGVIEGLTILSAFERSPVQWDTHPDRQLIPDGLKSVVDRWFVSRAKGN